MLPDTTVDLRAASIAVILDTPTTSQHEALLQLPTKTGRRLVSVGCLAACPRQLLTDASIDSAPTPFIVFSVRGYSRFPQARLQYTPPVPQGMALLRTPRLHPHSTV